MKSQQNSTSNHAKYEPTSTNNAAVNVSGQTDTNTNTTYQQPNNSNIQALPQNLPEKLHMPYIDLTQHVLNEDVSRRLPESYARRLHAILLTEADEQFLVGISSPLDIFASDELYTLLKKPIKFVLVNEQELLYKLDQLYRRTNEITDFADKLATELYQASPKNSAEEQAIKQVEPAVIRLLNSVFADAVQVGASDIHIEPAENILRIRLRVDGLLQEQTIAVANNHHIALALAQRLKLMSGLNIAEKRLPQDGRFEIAVRNTKIDVRLSTMPIQHGESIVMRLLNKSAKILSLDTTGMPTEMLKSFRRLIQSPHGMILVTGPTGSGKTTTLYGALSEINDVTKNIVTIEDPVEYTLDHANQIQVTPQIGLTFAKVLRSVLRQDPNIILVGEIRDQETASIALRAALTGHLVFATLHTNDATSTAIRLIDIGVEHYLVATTIRAIIAQRLARRICEHCASAYEPTEQESVFLTAFFGNNMKPDSFSHGTGCAHCNFTGTKGMVGVFELLELDNEMRETLRNKDTNGFVKTADKNRNSPNLLTNALEMATKKIISVQEVMRIAGEQS